MVKTTQMARRQLGSRACIRFSTAERFSVCRVGCFVHSEEDAEPARYYRWNALLSRYRLPKSDSNVTKKGLRSLAFRFRNQLAE